MGAPCAYHVSVELREAGEQFALPATSEIFCGKFAAWNLID